MTKHTKATTEKKKQLGIDPGTASSQLKKQVMFNLLRRLNENVCFRCGKMIKDVSDLSLDHKVEWLHSSDPTGLFFAQDNIAFSHNKCNVAAKRMPFSSRSSTGYKGVVKQKRSKKFKAVVTHKLDGKVVNKYLGYFDTAQEAAVAYDDEAIKLFGDRAVTNKSLGIL